MDQPLKLLKPAKSAKSVWLALTTGSMMLLTSINVEALAATEKVLYLHLDGDTIHQTEVWLSSKGIKLTDKLGSAYWFASKPSIFYLANPENKTYFGQTAEEYIDDFREKHRPTNFTRIERAPKKIPGDLKAEMVTAFSSDGAGHEIKVAEVTCLKNAGVTPAVNRMWCTLMGYPEKDFSLPIGAFQIKRVRRHVREAFYGGGRERWVVVALPKKIERRTVDQRFLNLPTDFKAAKDKASLYLSTDGNLNQKDLEDFFISSPKKK